MLGSLMDDIGLMGARGGLVFFSHAWHEGVRVPGYVPPQERTARGGLE